MEHISSLVFKIEFEAADRSDYFCSSKCYNTATERMERFSNLNFAILTGRTFTAEHEQSEDIVNEYVYRNMKEQY